VRVAFGTTLAEPRAPELTIPARQPRPAIALSA